MEQAKISKVADIVKSMSEAGMSVNEIKAQLSAMGLPADDVDTVLSKARAQPSHAEIQEEVKKVREKLETGENIRPVVDVVEAAGAEAHETKKRVEEMAKGFEEVKAVAKDVKDIRKPVEEIASVQKEMHREIKTVSGLGDEVQAVKDMLIDIKGLLTASQDINKKILDTNRKLLQKLEK